MLPPRDVEEIQAAEELAEERQKVEEQRRHQPFLLLFKGPKHTLQTLRT